MPWVINILEQNGLPVLPLTGRKSAKFHTAADFQTATGTGLRHQQTTARDRSDDPMKKAVDDLRGKPIGTYAVAIVGRGTSAHAYIITRKTDPTTGLTNTYIHDQLTGGTPRPYFDWKARYTNPEHTYVAYFDPTDAGTLTPATTPEQSQLDPNFTTTITGPPEGESPERQSNSEETQPQRSARGPARDFLGRFRRQRASGPTILPAADPESAARDGDPAPRGPAAEESVLEPTESEEGEESETREPAESEEGEKNDSLLQLVRDKPYLGVRIGAEFLNDASTELLSTMMALYFMKYGGPGAAGVAGLAAEAPYVGGALIAGHLADHDPPKKWMTGALTLAGLSDIGATITLISGSSSAVPILIGTTFVNAGAAVLYMTVAENLLVGMVGAHAQLGWNRLTNLKIHITRVLGRGMAPVALAAGAWPAALISLGANVVDLIATRQMPDTDNTPKSTEAQSMRESIVEGARTVRNSPVRRRTMANQAATNAYLGAQTLQLSYLLTHSGLPFWQQAGALAITPLGGVVGNLVPKRWLEKTTIDTLLTTRLAGLGAPAILAATTTSPSVAAAALAASWAAMGTAGPPLNTYLNNTTPPEVRARVRSIGFVANKAAVALGPPAAGGAIMLAGHQGASASTAVAFGTLAGWSLYHRLFKARKLLDCINQTSAATWALGLDTGTKPKKWQKSPEHLRRAIATQLVPIGSDIEDPVGRVIDDIRNLEDGVDTAVVLLDDGEKMHSLTITNTDNKPGGNVVIFDTNITNPDDPHTDPSDPDRIPRVRTADTYKQSYPRIEEAFVAYLTTDKKKNLTNRHSHDSSLKAPRKDGKVLGSLHDDNLADDSSEPSSVADTNGENMGRPESPAGADTRLGSEDHPSGLGHDKPAKPALPLSTEQRLVQRALDNLKNHFGPDATEQTLVQQVDPDDVIGASKAHTEKVAQWWDSLGTGAPKRAGLPKLQVEFGLSDEQYVMLQVHSRWIGNADGLPYAVRDKANRLAIEQRFEQFLERRPGNRRVLRTTLTAAEMAEFRNLLHIREQLPLIEERAAKLTGRPQVQVVAFDPAAHGENGRVLFSIGDLDNAEIVNLMANGFGSTTEKLYHRSGYAMSLNEITALRAAGTSVATLGHIGYHCPTDASVAVPHKAAAGGDILACDITGVHTTRKHDAQRRGGARMPRLFNLVGHSYGSTTTCYAGQGKRLATMISQVILTGSPGIGFAIAHADDFGVPVTVLGDPNDLVAQLGSNAAPADRKRSGVGLGRPPTAAEFGGRVLTTEVPTGPKFAVTKSDRADRNIYKPHASYYLWKDWSQRIPARGLDNMGWVLVGRADLAEPAEPRGADRRAWVRARAARRATAPEPAVQGTTAGNGTHSPATTLGAVAARETKETIAAEIHHTYGIEVLGLDKPGISVATARSIRNAIVDEYDDLLRLSEYGITADSSLAERKAIIDAPADKPDIGPAVLAVVPLPESATHTVRLDSGDGRYSLFIDDNHLSNRLLATRADEAIYRMMRRELRESRSRGLVSSTGENVPAMSATEIFRTLIDFFEKLKDPAGTQANSGFGDWRPSDSELLGAFPQLPADAPFSTWLNQLRKITSLAEYRPFDSAYDAFQHWLALRGDPEFVAEHPEFAVDLTELEELDSSGNYSLRTFFEAWRDKVSLAQQVAILDHREENPGHDWPHDLIAELGDLGILPPAQALAAANRTFAGAAPEDLSHPAYALQALLRGMTPVQVWRDTKRRNSTAQQRNTDLGPAPAHTGPHAAISADGPSAALIRWWRGLSAAEQEHYRTQGAPPTLRAASPDAIFALDELARLVDRRQGLLLGVDQDIPGTPEITVTEYDHVPTGALAQQIQRLIDLARQRAAELDRLRHALLADPERLEQLGLTAWAAAGAVGADLDLALLRRELGSGPWLGRAGTRTVRRALDKLTRLDDRAAHTRADAESRATDIVTAGLRGTEVVVQRVRIDLSGRILVEALPEHTDDTATEPAPQSPTHPAADEDRAAERSIGISERDIALLGELARGSTPAATAAALGLSDQQVRADLRHIRKFLRATSDTHAVVEAIRRGILDISTLPALDTTEIPEIPPVALRFLERAAQGLTTPEIARRVGKSTTYVREQLHEALGLLDAGTIREAVLKAIRSEKLTLPGVSADELVQQALATSEIAAGTTVSHECGISALRFGREYFTDRNIEPTIQVPDDDTAVILSYTGFHPREFMQYTRSRQYRKYGRTKNPLTKTPTVRSLAKAIENPDVSTTLAYLIVDYPKTSEDTDNYFSVKSHVVTLARGPGGELLLNELRRNPDDTFVHDADGKTVEHTLSGSRAHKRLRELERRGASFSALPLDENGRPEADHDETGANGKEAAGPVSRLGLEQQAVRKALTSELQDAGEQQPHPWAARETKSRPSAAAPAPPEKAGKAPWRRAKSGPSETAGNSASTAGPPAGLRGPSPWRPGPKPVADPKGTTAAAGKTEAAGEASAALRRPSKSVAETSGAQADTDAAVGAEVRAALESASVRGGSTALARCVIAELAFIRTLLRHAPVRQPDAEALAILELTGFHPRELAQYAGGPWIDTTVDGIIERLTNDHDPTHTALLNIQKPGARDDRIDGHLLTLTVEADGTLRLHELVADPHGRLVVSDLLGDAAAARLQQLREREQEGATYHVVAYDGDGTTLNRDPRYPDRPFEEWTNSDWEKVPAPTSRTGLEERDDYPGSPRTPKPDKAASPIVQPPNPDGFTRTGHFFTPEKPTKPLFKQVPANNQLSATNGANNTITAPDTNTPGNDRSKLITLQAKGSMPAAIADGMLTSSLGLMLLDAGASAQTLSLVSAGAFGAAMLADFASGPLTDRGDNLRLLKVASATQAAAMLSAGGVILFDLGGGQIAIIGATVVAAITKSLIDSAGGAYRKKLATTDEEKALAGQYNVLQGALASAVGKAAGPMLGPLSLASSGIAHLANRAVQQKLPSIPSAENEKRPGLLEGPKEMFNDRFMGRYLLISPAANFATSAAVTILTNVVHDGNYSPVTQGLLMSGIATGMVATRFTASKWADRAKLKIMFPASMAASVGLLLAYGNTSSPPILLGSMAAVGVTNYANNIAFQKRMDRVVSRKVLGGANSSIKMFANAGGILAGFATAATLPTWGTQTSATAFAAILGGATLGATALGYSLHKHEKDPLPAPKPPLAMPRLQLQPHLPPPFKAVVRRTGSTPVVALIPTARVLSEGVHSVAIPVVGSQPESTAPQSNTVAEPETVPQPAQPAAHDTWILNPLDPASPQQRPSPTQPTEPTDTDRAGSTQPQPTGEGARPEATVPARRRPSGTTDDADDLRAALTDTSCVLLDFDGPVADIFAGMPASDICDQLRDMLAAEGVTVPTHVAETSEFLDIVRFAATVGPELAHRIEERLTELETLAAASAEPTPGARECLEAFRRNGTPVVICSNNSAKAIAVYLARQGLEDLVDGVVGRPGSNVDLYKPHTHALRAASAVAGNQAPGRCVMIGDSASDGEAARAFGARSIQYANKPHKLAAFIEHGADAVVTDMRRIAQIASESDRVNSSATTDGTTAEVSGVQPQKGSSRPSTGRIRKRPIRGVHPFGSGDTNVDAVAAIIGGTKPEFVDPAVAKPQSGRNTPPAINADAPGMGSGRAEVAGTGETLAGPIRGTPTGDDAAAAEHSDVPDTAWQLWRDSPLYRLLTFNQFATRTGDELTAIVTPLLVVEQAGPGWAAAVGFASALPHVVLELLSGIWSDTEHPAKMQAISQLIGLVGAGTAATLISMGAPHLPEALIGTSLLTSVAGVLGSATDRALREVAGPDRMAGHSQISSTMLRVPRLVSYGLGPLALGLGRAVPSGIDALTYLWNLATLSKLREIEIPEVPKENVIAGIGRGFRAVQSHPILRSHNWGLVGSNLFLGFQPIAISMAAANANLGAWQTGMLALSGPVSYLTGTFVGGQTIKNVDQPRRKRVWSGPTTAQGWLTTRAVALAGAATVQAIASDPVFVGLGLATIWGTIGAATPHIQYYTNTQVPSEIRSRTGSISALTGRAAAAVGVGAGGMGIAMLGSHQASLAVGAGLVGHTVVSQTRQALGRRAERRANARPRAELVNDGIDRTARILHALGKKDATAPTGKKRHWKTLRKHIRTQLVESKSGTGTTDPVGAAITEVKEQETTGVDTAVVLLDNGDIYTITNTGPGRALIFAITIEHDEPDTGGDDPLRIPRVIDADNFTESFSDTTHARVARLRTDKKGALCSHKRVFRGHRGSNSQRPAPVVSHSGGAPAENATHSDMSRGQAISATASTSGDATTAFERLDPEMVAHLEGTGSKNCFVDAGVAVWKAVGVEPPAELAGHDARLDGTDPADGAKRMRAGWHTEELTPQAVHDHVAEHGGAVLMAVTFGGLTEITGFGHAVAVQRTTDGSVVVVENDEEIPFHDWLSRRAVIDQVFAIIVDENGEAEHPLAPGEEPFVPEGLRRVRLGVLPEDLPPPAARAATRRLEPPEAERDPQPEGAATIADELPEFPGRPAGNAVELFERILDAEQAGDPSAPRLRAEARQLIPDEAERAYAERYARNARHAAAVPGATASRRQAVRSAAFVAFRTALGAALAAATEQPDPEQMLADTTRQQMSAAIRALTPGQRTVLWRLRIGQSIARIAREQNRRWDDIKNIADRATNRIITSIASAHTQSDPLQWAVAEATPRQLQAALNHLEPARRRIIVALLRDGEQVTEVARALGLDETTVKQLAAGAVRRMAKHIAGQRRASTGPVAAASARQAINAPASETAVPALSDLELIEVVRRDDPAVLQWAIEHFLEGDQRRVAELLFVDHASVADAAGAMELAEDEIDWLRRVAKATLAEHLSGRLDSRRTRISGETGFGRGQRLAAEEHDAAETTAAFDEVNRYSSRVLRRWEELEPGLPAATPKDGIQLPTSAARPGAGHRPARNLTEKQVDVLRLLAAGKTSSEIMGYLGISENMLKARLAGIAREFGTGARAEMVAIARSRGIVRDDAALPTAVTGTVEHSGKSASTTNESHSANDVPPQLNTPPHGRLSPREAEVLGLAVKGLSNKEIGEKLKVSRHTVEYNVTRASKKYGTRGRAATIAAAGDPAESPSDTPQQDEQVRSTAGDVVRPADTAAELTTPVGQLPNDDTSEADSGASPLPIENPLTTDNEFGLAPLNAAKTPRRSHSSAESQADALGRTQPATPAPTDSEEPWRGGGRAEPPRDLSALSVEAQAALDEPGAVLRDLGTADHIAEQLMRDGIPGQTAIVLERLNGEDRARTLVYDGRGVVEVRGPDTDDGMIHAYVPGSDAAERTRALVYSPVDTEDRGEAERALGRLLGRNDSDRFPEHFPDGIPDRPARAARALDFDRPRTIAGPLQDNEWSTLAKLYPSEVSDSRGAPQWARARAREVWGTRYFSQEPISTPATPAERLARQADVAVATYSNTYRAGEHDGIHGWVDEDGVLLYQISTAAGTPSGRQMFRDMMDEIGSHVRAIRGPWSVGDSFSDNIDTFNAYRQDLGLSPEDAARRTFTGRMAGDMGFTEVTVNHLIGPGGEHLIVDVTFSKPESTASPQRTPSSSTPHPAADATRSAPDHAQSAPQRPMRGAQPFDPGNTGAEGVANVIGGRTPEFVDPAAAKDKPGTHTPVAAPAVPRGRGAMPFDPVLMAGNNRDVEVDHAVARRRKGRNDGAWAVFNRFGGESAGQHDGRKSPDKSADRGPEETTSPADGTTTVPDRPKTVPVLPQTPDELGRQIRWQRALRDDAAVERGLDPAMLTPNSLALEWLRTRADAARDELAELLAVDKEILTPRLLQHAIDELQAGMNFLRNEDWVRLVRENRAGEINRWIGRCVRQLDAEQRATTWQQKTDLRITHYEMRANLRELLGATGGPGKRNMFAIGVNVDPDKFSETAELLFGKSWKTFENNPFGNLKRFGFVTGFPEILRLADAIERFEVDALVQHADEFNRLTALARRGEKPAHTIMQVDGPTRAEFVAPVPSREEFFRNFPRIPVEQAFSDVDDIGRSFSLDSDGMRYAAAAYEVGYHIIGPFHKWIAESMLPRLRRRAAGNPLWRCMIVARDGHIIAAALRNIDPVFFEKYCREVAYSSQVIEMMAQDYERITGKKLPLPKSFRSELSGELKSLSAGVYDNFVKEMRSQGIRSLTPR